MINLHDLIDKELDTQFSEYKEPAIFRSSINAPLKVEKFTDSTKWMLFSRHAKKRISSARAARQVTIPVSIVSVMSF